MLCYVILLLQASLNNLTMQTSLSFEHYCICTAFCHRS